MRLQATLTLLLLLSLVGCDAQPPAKSPQVNAPGPPAAATDADEEADAATHIAAHVAFLADDMLEGREAGTRGYDLAAHYVGTQFQLLGLEPAGEQGSYFQDVPLLRGVRIAEGALLQVERNGKTTALAFEADWIPGLNYDAPEFSVTAPMVFVGHAVHAPELGHDDFSGVDLKGKVAVYFPKAPSRFHIDQRAFYSSSTEKMRQLVARGAIGAITLGDPRDEARRPWETDMKNWGRAGMRLLDRDGKPVDSFPEIRGRASVRAAAAAPLFEGSGHTLEEVFAQLRADKLASFDLTGTVTLSGGNELSAVTSRNVVALLRGSDPALAAEQVVFGAHLDHLGIGAPVEGDAIYNGAVDNALGVAILLQAAGELARGPRPARSLLFAAFTAEEKGLLGADQLARNPVGDPQAVVAMVNMDMPLILQPLQDVVPIGLKHSSLQKVVEDAARDLGLKLSPDPFPEEVVFIRSDQFPFIRQGIPAVYLDAGVLGTQAGSDAPAQMREFLRTHYHRPSDDLSQPIHYPTAARLAALNRRIGLAIANDPQRPSWNEGDFFGDKFAPH